VISQKYLRGLRERGCGDIIRRHAARVFLRDEERASDVHIGIEQYPNGCWVVRVTPPGVCTLEFSDSRKKIGALNSAALTLYYLSSDRKPK